MGSWWQLAIRNWRQAPGRTATALLAVALGVSVVVWVTCSYESVSQTVTGWIFAYIGYSHLTVETHIGQWGTLSEEVAGEVSQLPGVVKTTCRLWRPLYAPEPGRDRGGGARGVKPLAGYGIDPRMEYAFRPLRHITGRPLRPGDEGVAVIESVTAEVLNLGLGGTLVIVRGKERREVRYRVVGIIGTERLGRFQLPGVYLPLGELQQLTDKTGMVTTIDMMVDDPTPTRLHAVRDAAQQIAGRYAPGSKVSTAESRLQRVRNAQHQMEFLLMMISGVALLTSFFIILSTLLVGVAERVGQLGLMRCLGLTRLQVGGLILIEVLPMGVLGAVLGVPAGLGLMYLTVWWVPQYMGEPAISTGGIRLAVIGGVATALLAGLGPGAWVFSMSPLRAANPQLRRYRLSLVLLAFVVGLVLIVGQAWCVRAWPTGDAAFMRVAMVGVVTMYLGYALCTPLLVVLLGRLAVKIASGVLGLRRRLLDDQVDRTPWRSGLLCGGLMVALSLIVGMVVHSESLIAGWQFPRELPDAYVWTFEELPPETAELARSVPGVGQLTAISEFECTLGRTFTDWRRWLPLTSRFVTCDPDTFPELFKMAFEGGTAEQVLDRFRRGGAVIVAKEFAAAHDKKVGDTMHITVGGRSAEFEVAGIVTSVAVEMAVNYFHVQGPFQFAAVGAVFGTPQDAQRHFGIRPSVKMFLFKFDLPEEPVPAAFPPAEQDWPDDPSLRKVLANGKLERNTRWQRFRESQVIQGVKEAVGQPDGWSGSLQDVRNAIDVELRSVMHFLTVIPAVALIVGALGVGNLMTANVSNRARQIAIMRAVGTTKGQIVRLVLGEAVVLGLLGCMLGLLLGMHLAGNSNLLTQRIWGLDTPFTIPWNWVSAGMGFTILVCLIAGIPPARYAARNNIISALQST